MITDIRQQYQEEAYESLKGRSGCAVMPMRSGNSY